MHVQLDSEPALSTVTNLAISQLQRLSLQRACLCREALLLLWHKYL